MAPVERTLIVNPASIEPDHVQHDGYEYRKRLIVPRAGNQCTVAMMEIPPGKSAYPSHYHAGVTEVFYIIGGTGVLTTVDGEHTVAPGDVIVCPPGPGGTHKMTNPSTTESLRYMDFDTASPVDAPFYPESGKFSVIIDGEITGPFRLSSEVDYYDGE